MARKRIGVAGIGLIGRRHAELVSRSPGAALAAVADPSPQGRAVADRLGTRWHASAHDMLDRERLDGLIVAVPNQLHSEVGLAAIERGVPALIEKPIADTLEAGAALVLTAERRGVPLLVGHHRRYNPRVETARAILSGGEVGRLVALSALWAARKPDSYFDVAWRRAAGGGPILINLIHDVDCIRHLAGEIEEVQALAGTDVRGFAVEDTAVVVMRLAGGALASVTLTDAAPSPWGWEAGSGDNPGIAASGENCYRFLGTEASLDFPNLVLWRTASGGRPSWSEPLAAVPRPHPPGEALDNQLSHFLRVIEGSEEPRVSGREGYATLAATLAVRQAAQTRRPVPPVPLPATAAP